MKVSEQINMAKRYTPKGKPASHVSALAGTITRNGSNEHSLLGRAHGVSTSYRSALIAPTKAGYYRVDIRTGENLPNVAPNLPAKLANVDGVKITYLPPTMASNSGNTKPSVSIKSEADAIAHSSLVASLQAQLKAIKDSGAKPLSSHPDYQRVKMALSRLGARQATKQTVKDGDIIAYNEAQTRKRDARAIERNIAMERGRDALEAAVLASAVSERQAAIAANKGNGKVTPDLSYFVDAIFTRLGHPSKDAEGRERNFTDCYLIGPDGDITLASAIVADACKGTDTDDKVSPPTIHAILALRSRATPMLRNSTRSVRNVTAYGQLLKGQMLANDENGQTTNRPMIVARGMNVIDAKPDANHLACALGRIRDNDLPKDKDDRPISYGYASFTLVDKPATPANIALGIGWKDGDERVMVPTYSLRSPDSANLPSRAELPFTGSFHRPANYVQGTAMAKRGTIVSSAPATVPYQDTRKVSNAHLGESVKEYRQRLADSQATISAFRQWLDRKGYITRSYSDAVAMARASREDKPDVAILPRAESVPDVPRIHGRFAIGGQWRNQSDIKPEHRANYRSPLVTC